MKTEKRNAGHTDSINKVYRGDSYAPQEDKLLPNTTSTLTCLVTDLLIQILLYLLSEQSA